MSTLIPLALRECWLKSKPTDQTSCFDLGLGWNLNDLVQHVPGKIEAGGILFPAGFSLCLGDETSVFVSSSKFTWHSHTTEPCEFSLQDWCSFVLSHSVWSLLITPGHYRFYAKRDIQLASECREQLLGYSQNLPSVELMGRRLKKHALKKAPTNTEDLETDMLSKEFARATGIEISPEYSL